jgi:hypothetical protein
MVLSKDDLIECLDHELRILLHLCTKVEPAMLDYRPTPKQRTTLELLRYLTFMGPVIVPSIRAGHFLMDDWTKAEAHANTLDFAGVQLSLAGQAAFYRNAISAMSDDELREQVSLFGPPAHRGVWLANYVLAGHAAYRTQLFCYLKDCGRDELGTTNLWGGQDASH